MAVGFSANKADIDNRAGQLAISLRDDLARIKAFNAYLLATPDGNLTGMGYTSGEVAILKSAFNDLDQLRSIYEGAVNLTSAKDFRTFAGQLTGVI